MKKNSPIRQKLIDDATSETFKTITEEIDKLRQKTGWPPFWLDRLRSIWKILPDSKRRKRAEAAASWRLKKIDLNTEQLETAKREIQEKCFKNIDFEKGKLPAGAFIPAKLLKNVIQEIENAQDTNDSMKEHIVFFEHYNQAVTEYRTSKEPRAEKKQATFCKAMGLTEIGVTGRGKRPKKIDNEMLFWEYLGLVHTGSSRLAPWAALEAIQKRYNLQSVNGTLKEIQLYKTELKNALKAAGLNPDVLKGVIPGNPSKHSRKPS